MENYKIIVAIEISKMELKKRSLAIGTAAVWRGYLFLLRVPALFNVRLVQMQGLVGLRKCAYK